MPVKSEEPKVVDTPKSNSPVVLEKGNYKLLGGVYQDATGTYEAGAIISSDKPLSTLEPDAWVKVS